MYLARLMGYDYNIQYRSGNTNVVVDALSRLPEGPSGTLSLLSVPCLTFLEELKAQLAQDLEFAQFWQAIIDHLDEHTEFASCVDCQHTKYETKKATCLLCSVPVPCRPWEDLSLDFITGLPAFRGYTTILVVIDRFSKGIHLGMLPTRHTSYTVAVLFMDLVGKIHGMPWSLVSDHDPLFLSRFWQDLFRLS